MPASRLPLLRLLSSWYGSWRPACFKTSTDRVQMGEGAWEAGSSPLSWKGDGKC